jgi:hypothetical protein
MPEPIQNAQGQAVGAAGLSFMFAWRARKHRSCAAQIGAKILPKFFDLNCKLLHVARFRQGEREPCAGSVRNTQKQYNQGNTMNRTASTLVISAAMAGLVSGTVMTMTGCKSSGNAAASSTSMNKHDCKGMNSCKGQGGCNTSDMGCKGKNSCKGKGGCKVT